MTYADYTYYKDEYKGNMPETDFERLAVQASAKIRHNTFGRVDQENIVEDVKLCTCAITEKLKGYDDIAKKQGNKQSEKVGTMSITYNQVKTKKEQDIELYSIMKEYLANTLSKDGVFLLYRGC